MTTVLDRFFSAPSGTLFSWLSAGARHRQALIDVRELPAYVQRDIGLFDGDEAIARRLARPETDDAVIPTAMPMPCAHR